MIKLQKQSLLKSSMAKKEKKLPSIKTLILTSWETFKASLIPFIIISIIGFFGYVFLFLLTAVFGIASFASAISTVMKHIQDPLSYLQALPHINITLLFLGILLGTAGAIIIGVWFQAAVILIIDTKGKNIVYKKLFYKASHFIMPLFLVGAIESVIILGSMFVFVLPALLFSFFFAFVSYEVVLNNQKGMAALRRSTLFVQEHFWELLVRVFVLFVIVFFVQTVSANIASTIGKEGGSTGGLTFIVGRICEWFSTVYMIVLYKEVSRDQEREKGSNLQWVWIVTIFGWIIAGLLLYAIMQFAVQGGFQQLFDNMQKQQLQNKTFMPAQRQPIYQQTSGSMIQQL